MTKTRREYEYIFYYPEREYRPMRKVLSARRWREIEVRREEYERRMTQGINLERSIKND